MAGGRFSLNDVRDHEGVLDRLSEKAKARINSGILELYRVHRVYPDGSMDTKQFEAMHAFAVRETKLPITRAEFYRYLIAARKSVLKAQIKAIKDEGGVVKNRRPKWLSAYAATLWGIHEDLRQRGLRAIDRLPYTEDMELVVAEMLLRTGKHFQPKEIQLGLLALRKSPKLRG